jgi:hypothetical protein
MTTNRTLCLSLIITLSALTLIGCDEQAKTTQWYKSHPDEMNKIWAKCKKSGDDTQNCRNAIDAHYQLQQSNAPIPDLNDLPKHDYSKKG